MHHQFPRTPVADVKKILQKLEREARKWEDLPDNRHKKFCHLSFCLVPHGGAHVNLGHNLFSLASDSGVGARTVHTNIISKGHFLLKIAEESLTDLSTKKIVLAVNIIFQPITFHRLAALLTEWIGAGSTKSMILGWNLSSGDFLMVPPHQKDHEVHKASKNGYQRDLGR